MIESSPPSASRTTDSRPLTTFRIGGGLGRSVWPAVDGAGRSWGSSGRGSTRGGWAWMGSGSPPPRGADAGLVDPSVPIVGMSSSVASGRSVCVVCCALPRVGAGAARSLPDSVWTLPSRMASKIGSR